MDLVVARAQLPNAAPGALVDIGIADGRIVAIEPAIAADARRFDAAGRLVCAGLIETHIHLDKGRLMDRMPIERGRRIDPVRYLIPFKPEITEEDVHARAEATLRACLVHGTTRIRTHVEVDPKIGMRGFDAVAALAHEYRWAVDLELCVFPQDGLTNNPGTEELVIEGLRRGAKLVGGAPRYDSDESAQIRRIFEIAREHDVDIDLHLDVGPTADKLLVREVCDLTEQYKLGGRVTVGHMAKLSLLPPDALATIARRMADVGVAVTVLPATDLYLMGRDRDHSVVRGVADANALCEHGVNCSLSSNNVLNPATPFGDCSLIRMANMHANVLQAGQPEQLRECFSMLTDRSAKILRADDYGIAVGNPADVVVFAATSPERAIAEVAQPVAVFKRGRRTVAWDTPVLGEDIAW
jgi:cytosine deaminase